MRANFERPSAARATRPTPRWPLAALSLASLAALSQSAAVASSVSEAGKTSGAQVAAGEHVRRLPLEGAVNFRDLGGYAGAGGKHVRWGLLYRSDALDGLSPADTDLLDRLNVARITDFRGLADVARRPDRLPAQLRGRYVNLPIDDTPARRSPETAKAAAAASAQFRAALDAPDSPAKFETISSLITGHYYPRLPRDGRASYSQWIHGLLDEPGNAAQVFHCTGGADRAGLASALLLLTLGVSKDDVLKDYLLTNEFLFSDRARALTQAKGLPPMPRELQLQPSYLAAAFRAMEADYGSVDNYIRHGLGVDDEMRRRLRAKYLE